MSESQRKDLVTIRPGDYIRRQPMTGALTEATVRMERAFPGGYSGNLNYLERGLNNDQVAAIIAYRRARSTQY